MKRFLPLLLLIICSCSQEQFSVSSLSLHSESTVEIADGEESGRSDVLILSAAFSIEEDSYSFSVTDPQGELAWEGSMSGSGVRTAELEITRGALYPEGNYHYIFYSDQGTELSGDIEYQRDDDYPHYAADGLSREAYVTETDENGSRVAYGMRSAGSRPSDFAADVRIEWTDRFSNRYEITQSVR